MEHIRHSQLMGEGDPLIVLNLDLQEPAELGDFVGAFVALSSQFERYTTTEHADPKGRRQDICV